MRRLILFDLDNTLFDPASFRAQIFSKFAEIIDKEKKAEIVAFCQHLYDEQIKAFGVFNPERFIHSLTAKLHKGKIETLLAVVFAQDTLKDHFHSDSVETIKKLKNKAIIGILSQGEEKLQRAKLASIIHHFHPSHIHIPENKKKEMREILQRYEEYKIIFVDDMLPMLFEAKKNRPGIKTVWIKRGRYALLQQPIKGFTPDATISSLTELEKIVER
ncbi:MAG: HAD family hydrolase [Candidatus Levybacteria bacterium]|nr:HAD family hydrolase [Candidatus Levybacteria bacterium]